jgi:hypothetical protein
MERPFCGKGVLLLALQIRKENFILFYLQSGWFIMKIVYGVISHAVIYDYSFALFSQMNEFYDEI